MTFPTGTTFPTSVPTMIADGYASGMPRVFLMRSTAVSSAVAGTGFLAGCGEGSRSGSPVGLRLFDVVLHVQTTDTLYPGRVSLHAVVASTPNVASTSLSSGFNAGFDITLSNSTST